MGEYTVIGAGLAIGLFARWAVMQSVGQPVTWREVQIDLMIVLMNGLLAVQFGETLGLHGTKLAVAAAMFGASSTMVFAKLHAKFLASVDHAPVTIFTGADTQIEVPHSAPDAIVRSIGPNETTTRAQAAVERIADTSTDMPRDAEIEALTRRLNELRSGKGKSDDYLG